MSATIGFTVFVKHFSHIFRKGIFHRAIRDKESVFTSSYWLATPAPPVLSDYYLFRHFLLNFARGFATEQSMIERACLPLFIIVIIAAPKMLLFILSITCAFYATTGLKTDVLSVITTPSIFFHRCTLRGSTYATEFLVYQPATHCSNNKI